MKKRLELNKSELLLMKFAIDEYLKFWISKHTEAQKIFENNKLKISENEVKDIEEMVEGLNKLYEKVEKKYKQAK